VSPEAVHREPEPQENTMTTSTHITALRYALIATGVIFIFGLETLGQVWPSGWQWGIGHSHYWPMIVSVYATLGAFLIRASRDPLGNLSLIWFTVWSNLAHSLAMAFSALQDSAERGHLIGDVPALLIISAALTILTQRACRTEVVTPGIRWETRSAA
jgi:hypothetical protein